MKYKKKNRSRNSVIRICEMEQQLPVEVIGTILSLGSARDGVVASTTCKTWREAWLNHLKTLSFDHKFHSKYYSTSQLEIIITQTILQTRGLQCLSISVGEDGQRWYYSPSFSDVSVISWLMYTRDTLRRLCFNADISPRINILEKCGTQKKLEDLVLCHTRIPKAGVNTTYRALKSLTLSYVTISPLNLSLYLTSCPKLEALSLIGPRMSYADRRAPMKLTSASLKDIFVESLQVDKFIIEAGGVENLRLKRCTLELLELVGKGSLRALHIEDSSRIDDINLGENSGNLEVFDVSKFTFSWPKFYRIIPRLSKLRKLRLWDVEFNDECNYILDWESIFVRLPELSQLSLSDHALFCSSYAVCFPSISQPSLSYLQNVTLLALGFTVAIDVFSDQVSAMLQRCPGLKKLVVYRRVSKTSKRDSKVVADLTASIVRLMRKYNLVDVKLEYKYL